MKLWNRERRKKNRNNNIFCIQLSRAIRCRTVDILIQAVPRFFPLLFRRFMILHTEQQQRQDIEPLTCYYTLKLTNTMDKHSQFRNENNNESLSYDPSAIQ